MEVHVQGVGGGSHHVGNTGPVGLVNPTAGQLRAGGAAIADLHIGTGGHYLQPGGDHIGLAGLYGHILVGHTAPVAGAHQFHTIVAVLLGVGGDGRAGIGNPTGVVAGLKVAVLQNGRGIHLNVIHVDKVLVGGAVMEEIDIQGRRRGGDLVGLLGPIGCAQGIVGENLTGGITVFNLEVYVFGDRLIPERDGVADTLFHGDGGVHQATPRGVAGQFSTIVTGIGGIGRSLGVAVDSPALGGAGLKGAVAHHVAGHHRNRLGAFRFGFGFRFRLRIRLGELVGVVQHHVVEVESAAGIGGLILEEQGDGGIRAGVEGHRGLFPHTGGGGVCHHVLDVGGAVTLNEYIGGGIGSGAFVVVPEGQGVVGVGGQGDGLTLDHGLILAGGIAGLHRIGAAVHRVGDDSGGIPALIPAGVEVAGLKAAIFNKVGVGGLRLGFGFRNVTAGDDHRYIVKVEGTAGVGGLVLQEQGNTGVGAGVKLQRSLLPGAGIGRAIGNHMADVGAGIALGIQIGTCIGATTVVIVPEGHRVAGIGLNGDGLSLNHSLVLAGGVGGLHGIRTAVHHVGDDTGSIPALVPAGVEIAGFKVAVFNQINRCGGCHGACRNQGAQHQHSG